VPNSALPENLKDSKHDDWIWPFCYIPRGLTAFKWKMPPKLLLGYNVMIWDTSKRGDVNRLIYPFGRGFLTWKNRIAVRNAQEFGPNAIQKILGTWKISFHLTWPLGFHMTIKLWRYKKLTRIAIEDLERGYDGVRLIYFRCGDRWDSFDAYHQCPGFFVGFTYN